VFRKKKKLEEKMVISRQIYIRRKHLEGKKIKKKNYTTAKRALVQQQ